MKKLKTRKSFRFKPLVLVAGLLIASIGTFGISKTIQLAAEDNFGGIRRFIVTFKDAKAVSSLNEEIAEGQRAKILATQNYAKESMSGADAYLAQVTTYENLPMAVYEADLNGYKKLKESGLFSSIIEDRIIPVEKSSDKILNTLAGTLPSPVVALGGDAASATPFSDDTNSYSGDGYSIAIIDTGVDKTHEALEDKVIFEYCRSTTSDGKVTISGHAYEIKSLCPDGDSEGTGEGAAAPCESGCVHGTLVAGAAVGTPKQSVSANGLPSSYTNADTGGVAPGAKIIAMKVVSEFHASTSNSVCGTDKVCVSQLLSDVYKALDWLGSHATDESVHQGTSIVAANISLGSDSSFASTVQECEAFSDATNFKNAITKLKTMKIATVIATGNSGENTSLAGKIAFPSCLVPEAVAVSATNNDGSRVADYANNGALTDLLAPGEGIWPTIGANNPYTYESGTSFAAPIAAASFAILREKYPNADIDILTEHLRATGKKITDTRSGFNSVQKPRINLAAALSTDIDGGQGELPDTDSPCPYDPTLIYDDPNCKAPTPTPTPPPPAPETPKTGFFTTDDGQIKASAILTSISCMVLAVFVLRFIFKRATKKSVALIKRW